MAKHFVEKDDMLVIADHAFNMTSKKPQVIVNLPYTAAALSPRMKSKAEAAALPPVAVDLPVLTEYAAGKSE